MAKPRKLTNADKVVLRLAEAIQRGHVVAFSGAGGRGTMGPYHPATGPARFAVFFDGNRWARYGVHSGRSEGNAQSVAWAVVDAIGVANTIKALKAAQVGYVNLDTRITVAPGQRVAGGRRAAPSGATLGELDALVLRVEAAGVERTPIGFVANIRGRLIRDDRSRFWRSPPAGSWGGSQGTRLTQGEIVAAVHALRVALARGARGGRSPRGGRQRIDAAGPVGPQDYPGLFQDTNRDGIPDVDDPDPKGPPRGISIETTRLSDELAA